MAIETRNLIIDQGATFVDEFVWCADSLTTPGTPGDPIPLTGATVRMQIRKAQGEPVLLSASSPDDGIVLDEAAGKVTYTLTPAKTNGLVHKSCRYDIEAAFSEDDVHRLVEGNVTVRPNITQDPGEPIVGR